MNIDTIGNKRYLNEDFYTSFGKYIKDKIEGRMKTVNINLGLDINDNNQYMNEKKANLMFQTFLKNQGSKNTEEDTIVIIKDDVSTK